MMGQRLWLAAALALAAGGVRADEPPGPDAAVEEAVDHYVDAKLGAEKIRPAPAADDATLVRRLTLDLLGRVPTEAEARAYVDSTDPEKRARLVDRLLASPGFVRHQAESFDAVLMAGLRSSLRDYLLAAFRAGRPWDQVFRELMAADESTPELKGSAGFLRPRAKDLDRLTSDVSSIFLGINVSCARCHDHPRVKDWTQEHFFGMKSFFGRTYLEGEFVAERDRGGVTYKTVGGEERKARFMFLNGRVVEPPPPAGPGETEAEKKARREAKTKVPPPRPAFSARGKLVDLAVEPGEGNYLARSVVNRLWHRFLGTGLVMPLDQMHPANPASHPELLDWLARDTASHGFDLRRLTRGLVLSRAYARSSRWEAPGERPDPRLFAVGPVRPLTPMQLATSVWLATADPAALPETLGPDAVDSAVAGLEGRARDLAHALARPGEDYQIGAPEALLLSNSDRLKDAIGQGDGAGRLVGRLLALDGPRARADLAVRNVLSRPPDDEELALLAGFLDEHADRPAEGCRQLVWSLVTGAEFRFNH